MAKSADLDLILDYNNQTILDYFCHHHPEFDLQEASLLFKDLLAWMWLHAQRTKQNKKTYLFGPLLTLDELWHAFILHTRDYTEFSYHYFGSYFHHEIEPIGAEYTLQENELIDFLEDCIQYLGSEWVERHFKNQLL